ncbi:MAG: hypothetical protein EU549_03315 [Promethearchaeota archaeon]|nr:MAG: hypothetical protein EU549_03315 [Candidatus Lokiarchaeota archaeon]
MKREKKLELMQTMFNPRNVAIVGGTDNIMKIGAFSVLNIRSCGYRKNAYIINPNPKYKNKKIFGLDVYPSLDKCPEKIDLVGVVVPPRSVIDTVKQAIDCDIHTAAIITAGFGEVKTEDRQAKNRELIDIAEKGDLIFVGPNSMGLYTSEDSNSPLHLGFGVMTPKPGNIAIISQSGTIGTLLCSSINKIKYFVSSGNEASLLLEDYLEYFSKNDEVDTISLFIEGLRDAKRFQRLSSKINKPIVLFKAGITKSGSRAANTHTGSISGSEKIYKAIAKQKGIIYTDNITEFIHLTKGSSFLLPLPKHYPLRIGIVSGGGGIGVHLADLCEKHGLHVVDLKKEPMGDRLINEISDFLPFFWSKNNPFDLVATRDFNLFPKLTELIFKYDLFDVIITQTSVLFKKFLSTFQPMDEFGRKMKKMMSSAMGAIAKENKKREIELCLKYSKKKIVFISPITDFNDPIFDDYNDNKILVVGGNPEMAAIVLKKLQDYQKIHLD